MGTTVMRRHLPASPDRVTRALMDPVAVQAWMVPDGMTSEVHAFEGREGGAFRISLTYEEPDAQGKSQRHTDTQVGRFVRVVPGQLVEQRVAFETDDPAFQGEMAIAYRLEDDGAGGTWLEARHEGLPEAVPLADNEAGWAMSLGKLAAWLAAHPG